MLSKLIYIIYSLKIYHLEHSLLKTNSLYNIGVINVQNIWGIKIGGFCHVKIEDQSLVRKDNVPLVIKIVIKMCYNNFSLGFCLVVSPGEIRDFP